MPSCPRCGAELAGDEARCEQCGHVLAAPAASAAPPVPRGHRLIAGLGCGMLAVMLVLISIVVVFGLLLGGLLGAAAVRS